MGVSPARVGASADGSRVYVLCEIASSTNCDQATVTIDLSGGG